MNKNYPVKFVANGVVDPSPMQLATRNLTDNNGNEVGKVLQVDVACTQTLCLDARVLCEILKVGHPEIFWEVANDFSISASAMKAKHEAAALRADIEGKEPIPEAKPEKNGKPKKGRIITPGDDG